MFGPSLQARIAIFVLRNVYRPAWKRSGFDIQKFREGFANALPLRMFRPKGVEITEVTIAGVPCFRMRTKSFKIGNPRIMYFHGGGFVLGVQPGQIEMCGDLCRRMNAEILIPNYRLAPEHCFPAGLDDCAAVVEAWHTEAASEGSVFAMGDSAGGMFALVTLATDPQKRRWNGLILLSPVSGGMANLAPDDPEWDKDAMFDAATLSYFRKAWVGTSVPDPKDPRWIPLLASWKHFPPIWLSASTNEALFLDSKAVEEKALAEGLPLTTFFRHHLYHVFPISGFLPEAKVARESMVQFMKMNSVSSL